MTRRYRKHTRNQTETEKMTIRTIRYLLRQGIDVRVSFKVAGTKNAEGLAAQPSEPVPDADGRVPYVEPTWEEVRENERRWKEEGRG